MSDIQSYNNIGPGEMLKVELEALGWSQDDFAGITGMSLKAVNELLNDKTALTVETARLISKAIGTSAEAWLRLDAAFRLRHLEESEREKEAERYGSVMKVMPVREMVKKGWLPPYDSASRLLREARDFWEVKEPDFGFLEKRTDPCLRRSQGREYYEKFYALAWTRKAELSAAKWKLPVFDKIRAKVIGTRIPELSREEEGIDRFIAELGASGIGFIVLSHLRKTYLDGAALFVKKNPFIVYTGRYDRNDNFWFTAAHELAHIALGHLKKEGDHILDELKDAAESEQEKAADKLASVYLKMDAVLAFCEPYRQYLSRERIRRCADALGLHPGIVVGTLQHEGLLSYKNLNNEKHTVKVKIPASRFEG
jgi:HTH-type transcriptional regulator/antitoxin HigA